MEVLMSISSVGASGFGNPSQILAMMLSRLDNTQSTNNTTTSSTGSGNATPATFAAPGNDAGNALTGTDQSKLSDRILAVLVELQQQSSAGNSNPANGANAPAPSASAIGNPVQQLFSAMDGNGDGSVSQSEMETYIQAQGGTQSQADELFSSLDQNGSDALSETQLAGDVAQGHRAHHGHHHHGEASQTNSDASSSTADLASQIFGALDGNQDGTLSSAELMAGTQNSNPASGPVSGSASNGNPDLLAQIDSNGNGSISNSEFSSYFASLEQQIQSDTTAMNALMQRAAQAYGSAANMFDPASLMASGSA
jgi:Ca2+-binding EF-hand superfamily protein